MKLEDIQLDDKYKDIFKATQTERETIEQLAVQDREIYHPLAVWRGQDILIFGYQYLPILKAHPEIKYTILEMDFADWQEAQIWAVEHYIAQPVLIMWSKLEAAINCAEYWLLKEKAKKAHGNRSESSSGTEDNSAKDNEVCAIIAKKCGCGTTTVYNFKFILESGREDIIKKCRAGDLSISAAYSQLHTPKKKRGKKSADPESIELKITNDDLFEECEANSGKGVKRTYRTPVDPTPVVEKISVAHVPEEAIWITLHKKDGQMQVVQHHYDKATGKTHAKINAYLCKMVENTDDLMILQAEHIPASTAEVACKDDRDFDQMTSLAS